MKPITAILVDDELSALKGLQKKLNKHFKQLEIVGEFQIPEKAVEAISILKPDIIFLDIEMPRMSGLELLTQLKSLQSQVIFVTAYNEYAFEAFNKCAVGYVLKPIDDDELVRAVDNALETVLLKNESEHSKKLIQLLQETITGTQKLIIPTGKGLSFIPFNEVVRLEGYEGYTKFHLIDAAPIVSSYNLGKFEKSLPAKFFKCHKSHIINLEKVRGFENEGYLLLENGTRVPISKTKRKLFLEMFN